MVASVYATKPIFSEDPATVNFLYDLRQLHSCSQVEDPNLFIDVDEDRANSPVISLGYKEKYHESKGKLKEWTKDMRCDESENWIARFVYGPGLIGSAFITVGVAIFSLNKLRKVQSLSDEEIKELDSGSWFDFTVRELYDFNKKRGEEGKPMLKDPEVLVVHGMLNNRTEFSNDDTFAQRVACDAYIYKMQTKHLSREEQIIHNKSGILDYGDKDNSGYEALEK